jgi:hypothetical protein
MAAGRSVADSECILHRHSTEASMNQSSCQFQLQFRSLFSSGRGYAFPCDPSGQVDLDQLNERARSNYLYARAMVGRELSWPDVVVSQMQ